MKYRGVKQITLLEISIAEGKGTEKDPVRIVKYYVERNKGGKVLFTIDPEKLK